MTKYTAADFANARFAEHEDGQTARVDPSMGKPNRWSMGSAFLKDDSAMALYGWVPVPTKPTIKMSDYKRAVLDGESFTERLELLGIEIIPDPEPTNAEKIERLILDARLGDGRTAFENFESVKAWAEYLAANGAKVED